ncbi:MAG TPA: flagellar assembly peptidoglycan hydrolase FlgJ, partial [Accumulibacter sp.]|nr:flagellar assembly peptidoglycan hydrolase FlgJ [Accumulibacter sp.]
AYASYADAFRDYASLLASKPRFAAVLGQQDGTQFARSLQQAGYATDPMYADKLTRIIDGPLLRQALTG